jgi:gas vesicle protein
MSLQEILTQAEALIRTNISQYREQLQKDIGTFSESLKKEYETIKGSTQSMLDGLANRLEQKIKAMGEETRETVLKELTKHIESIISQPISDLNVKLTNLEAKLSNDLEELKKTVTKDVLEVSSKIELSQSDFKTEIDKQKQTIIELQTKLQEHLEKKFFSFK